MARVNVYLPDDLARTIADKYPDLNVSATVQAALRDVIGCDHHALACATCAESVDGAELRAEALNGFYRDLFHELGVLVTAGGTLEGAARVAKSTAQRWGIEAADNIPLPRLTRAERAHLAAVQ